jgi:hypothetical protein
MTERSQQVEKENEMEPNKTEHKPNTIVSALLDLGSAWAAHGLDAGKLSLENSAKMLTRTAKTLETLALEFESKAEKKKAGAQQG